MYMDIYVYINENEKYIYVYTGVGDMFMEITEINCSVKGCVVGHG